MPPRPVPHCMRSWFWARRDRPGAAAVQAIMTSVGASHATWLAPGCHLDRYDLLLLVAEGGMGLLWLARQQGKHGFDKIVAIKTILPKLASDSAFRQMFLDEARVVSRIEHPNVVQVLDLGEERGVLFLVMKWIDGESLTNLGRAVACETAARIPVGILTRIMMDVCAGLHAVHELTDDEGLALGVVHRDVSPQNLLVGFRGTTKVIDFGIAEVRNRMAKDPSMGLLKGKLAYMAPEQAMGNGVDRRTDVWSAGASMYRFLTGRVPYDASEPVAVFRLIAEGRPVRLPTTVPEPIRFVVEQALEPDPRRRFETAHDMGAALETAMRVADIHTTREDVAAFMVEHLGEARAIRAREIENAVRESRARMRVELARTESASEAALPIVRNDASSGPSPVSAASPDEPSRHPTVALAASQPPIGSTEVFQALRHETVDSTRLRAETRDRVTTPTSSIAAAFGVQGGARRPIVRWITGSCLLAILLAGGFAWRGAQRSRPIGAPNVAGSPTRFPEPRETSTVPTSGASAGQATVSAPDPSPPVPFSAHSADQRASAIALAEPGVPEHGSAGDLLARARHARRAGRIDDAAALFAAAVQAAPTDSEALTGLAEVDEAQGATLKALVDYRRALAVNPKYLPARLGLADSLWTSGQRDEARIVYRNIVSQVPKNLCPDLARERAAGSATNEKTPK
jgi:eukaryotic-like serine/threonine-protein kinase